jgi:hypothetical protein
LLYVRIMLKRISSSRPQSPEYYGIYRKVEYRNLTPSCYRESFHGREWQQNANGIEFVSGLVYVANLKQKF